MPLQIIRSDITKVSADAIVNSTNPNPSRSGYGGADFHIYEAAGRNVLQKARDKIGNLNVADIAVTPAFALNAKFIIHTVGPRWNDGRSGELFALENCYMRSLEKARELGCESIAFSLISSGSYRFPKDLALKTAVETIGSFLQTNEMDVTLVVFDRESFEISAELDKDIQAFIDENYVQKKKDLLRLFREENLFPKTGEISERHPGEPRDFEQKLSACSDIRNPTSTSTLEEFLTVSAETFQQRLFQLIREKNLDDTSIYKKANLSRQHFSKIRSDIQYKPKKKTVLALAVAMQLSLAETENLLAHAGFALSPADRTDQILTYFILRQKFDIWEINNVLFKYDEPTLGM